MRYIQAQRTTAPAHGSALLLPSSRNSSTLQRMCARCEEEEAGAPALLRRSPGQAGHKSGEAVPSIVHDVLRSGEGRPLESEARRFFAPRFGWDFADVRVHTGPRADASARAVNARAYTVGNQIVFRQDAYAPNTREGKRTLAHELVHTLQQSSKGASGVSGLQPLTIGPSNDPTEEEADRIAGQVLDAEPRGAGSLPGGRPALRRAPMVARETGGGSTTSCGPFTIPYTVASGDTASGIAAAHDTTLTCLERLNPDVDLEHLSVGQSLNVPGTCSVPVPSNANEQILAGVVFAEAEQSRVSNDEREAIASVFTNRVAHVQELCNGTICTYPSAGARSTQCTRDTTDFGATIADAVSTGSAAYGGGQWDKVMDGFAMRSSSDICARIQPGELAPLLRALTTASAMLGVRGRRRFVAFNRGSTPPSARMEFVERIGAHGFYRFRDGSECG